MQSGEHIEPPEIMRVVISVFPLNDPPTIALPAALFRVSPTADVGDVVGEINATDPTTLVSVTGFFLIVALGACLIPGWRASRVDPVRVLREEP